MINFQFDNNVPQDLRTVLLYMREAFGDVLSGTTVEVHWGRDKWWKLKGFSLEWVAAATDSDIYFTEDANFRGSAAHELWHVVQKRNGDKTQFLSEAKATRLNSKGDAKEGEASLVEGVFQSAERYNRFLNLSQFATFLTYAEKVGITLPDWSEPVRYKIEYYETPNLWKIERTVETITMHATRSGKRLTSLQEFRSTINHFQNELAEASTEFVVGPGIVAVFVDPTQALHSFAAATRYAHWHLGLGFTHQAKRTVGIEVVQSFPDDPYDPKVMVTVAELLADLEVELNIPLVHIDPIANPTARGVFGHEDVKLGNSDPGYQFDWDLALGSNATLSSSNEADSALLPNPDLEEVMARMKAAGLALLGEK